MWQLFLNKLERALRSEDKASTTDLPDQTDKSPLAARIWNNMEASLGNSLAPVSQDDLENFLQQDGWPTDIPATKLAPFLLYLNFQDWADFQRQYRQQHTEALDGEKANKRSKGFGFNDLPYFGPVLLLLYYPFFFALKVL